MTEPSIPHLRRTAFKHDATHLHALWQREGAKALAMAASVLTVAEVAEGLACYSKGREVGRVTVREGAVTASPPFAAGTIFADRITHTELAAWLISAAARLS